MGKKAIKSLSQWNLAMSNQLFNTELLYDWIALRQMYQSNRLKFVNWFLSYYEDQINL